MTPEAISLRASCAEDGKQKISMDIKVTISNQPGRTSAGGSSIFLVKNASFPAKTKIVTLRSETLCLLEVLVGPLERGTRRMPARSIGMGAYGSIYRENMSKKHVCAQLSFV